MTESPTTPRFHDWVHVDMGHQRCRVCGEMLMDDGLNDDSNCPRPKEPEQHQKSAFAWERVFYAQGQKAFLSIYRARGTSIAIEHIDYPHHSETSEWKGVDIYVFNQTTFHDFHNARTYELQHG